MNTRSVLLAVLIGACALTVFGDDCPTGANWCSGLYRYDGMGNIRAIGSDTYIYDTAGRLVSGTAEVQRGGTSRQDYTYDTFGNRTGASSIAGSADCLGGCEQSPAIDPATNHITSNGAQYDAAGNLIAIQNTVNGVTYSASYTYDSVGRLARATAGSDDRQFIYTADDERIATRNGQNWTWTVRDLDNKVVREFTSLEPNGQPGLPTLNRQWAKDYIWRDGLLLATVTPTTPGANTTVTRHYHLDHLGTPRMVTGDNGAQLAIHAYYPFGAELNLTPTEQPVELMKFTGHERDLLANDAHTLDYMHARYDMATMGRFLSVDPTWDSADLAHPQAWNRYSYVRNNPIGNTDPDGKICIPCAAFGALAAVSYESYRQVSSGEPVNNDRLLAAVGIGAVAGATLGAAAEAAPVVYNAVLANPGTVATATSVAGAMLGPPGPSSSPEIAFEKATTQLAGELQYTKTASQSLAKASRDIPGQTIAGAILSGARSADPQVAKGAIQITQDVYKSAVRGGISVQVKYQLRIIYNETEKLVMPANIKEIQ